VASEVQRRGDPRDGARDLGLDESSWQASANFWQPPRRSWPYPPTKLALAERLGVDDEELREPSPGIRPCPRANSVKPARSVPPAGLELAFLDAKERGELLVVSSNVLDEALGAPSRRKHTSSESRSGNVGESVTSTTQ
jgi:hypothetical protein